MRNSRPAVERDMIALPQDEARDVVRWEAEPSVIDLTLLRASPRPAPVQDLQHWLDLCG
jgi:hypothetical protein